MAKKCNQSGSNASSLAKLRQLSCLWLNLLHLVTRNCPRGARLQLSVIPAALSHVWTLAKVIKRILFHNKFALMPLLYSTMCIKHSKYCWIFASFLPGPCLMCWRCHWTGQWRSTIMRPRLSASGRDRSIVCLLRLNTTASEMTLWVSEA